ncbi:hypothetical protein FIBSPDRAFT_1048354 [Athelia psychrophila]|uniref:Uncharacterized protein n=1 Tax=Athelia psychrophila TaxID=1759441 RepID=A0A166DVS1_9AGAM|nr:hypothetical protein FIBSPDRAFT_1048354 [Fibularhizoctonia sp. CBS 109695]
MFGWEVALISSVLIGDAKIVIEKGAVIGVQTGMGSGAQGRKDTDYQDRSKWMGKDPGEATRFNHGAPSAKPADTITPFGHARTTSAKRHISPSCTPSSCSLTSLVQKSERTWPRLFAGSKTGLAIGSNLVELGDDVDVDDCSVVVHINSRGNCEPRITNALSQTEIPRVHGPPCITTIP